LTMAESVQLPDDIQRRLNALKAIGALGVCAIYGWFAIVKDTQVPVLVFLDVAVHEVGHKLFSPFGDLVMLVMGTGSWGRDTSTSCTWPTGSPLRCGRSASSRGSSPSGSWRR
jgi:hypothetical protein